MRGSCCTGIWKAFFTTGGTGFGVRDVTPEATARVLHTRAPGLVAAMLHAGLAATPFAALSRYEAGLRLRPLDAGRATLIVNLPGSPRAVQESIHAIAPVLVHGIMLASSGARSSL